MSLWRLVRCNPWSYGGVDYVQVKDEGKPRDREIHKKDLGKVDLIEKKEKVKNNG